MPMPIGPFRGSEAVRSGLLTKRQLEGSRWRRLHRDVYVAASIEITLLVRCQAVGLLLPDAAAISGPAAALLLGADIAADRVAVEITVGREIRMGRHAGVTVRYSQLRPHDVIVVAGVPVTGPVRTAFDLARRGPLVDSVIAVDALLQARGVTVDAVVEYLHDGRSRWHGARRAKDALALAASGAESPMETRLRLALTCAGAPRPVLQHPVRDESGVLIARLDLAYVEARIGIEYDGGHHWDPRTVRRDLRRQNALHALGWTLLRFTADDVLYHPARVVAQVGAVLCRTPATREAVAARP